MGKNLLAIVFAAGLIAVGCSDDDDSSASGGEASSGGESADLQLSSSDLGEILVDADGKTLYLFVPDAQGDSTCYDECEANWPVVGELASVGAGLDADLLGSTDRTTGDVQATYNGWPLYYFAADEGAGDMNGQGVNDVWYVLDADGNAVGAE